uniref:General transcription factor IIF subunit 2 n=1 Tax=Strigamia maritima TaxID=126957 RepID=T1IKY7_STRMM
MDCVNASNGVWLVKVPKYISEQWSKSSAPDVGKLSISKVDAPRSGSALDIRFVLNDCLAQNSDDGPIPKEHEFLMTNNTGQKLYVCSQSGEKVGFEGRVIERAECRPSSGDKDYIKMKKLLVFRANQPVRTVKQLGVIVNFFKPIADHQNNIDFDLKKKNEGFKVRSDKGKVQELLFEAFEKHQYYSIKDLVRVTLQPMAYLKLILKEFCNYNIKNPHKNMWQLKPEYGQYTMDCVNASNGVWLVKVPKYISEQWSKSSAPDVGKLSISKVDAPRSGSALDIRFVLNDCLAQNSDDGPIPKEHEFLMTNNTGQKLYVCSQSGEKVGFEGRVIERAECRPSSGDKDYIKMKKLLVFRANQPVRTVKQLGVIVNFFKPIADHQNNIDFDLKKKNEGFKVRSDKGKVQELLFEAFEKHQYYSIKDLVRVTLQPMAYLKLILKEFCNYNIKNPHKNMWQLKPEYGQYSKKQKKPNKNQ